MSQLIRFSLLAALTLVPVVAQTARDRGLLLISIDGMRPDYVSAADRHGLKIPNLRQIFADGSHAQGVRGVLPTVTYPSHTTIVTGVWPVKHGIPANTTFDPLGSNQSGWFWYSEDIHVPTLWEAAAKAGYVVGSVSWPVTVGARGISWLVPEYWRAGTAEDNKLMSMISTTGLIKELEPRVGPYITDLNNAIPGDWARTHYAEAIIRLKHTRVMTVHLAALDHIEHASGPFSAESNAALEEIDRMVGTLVEAMRRETRNAAICIVSDHGFAATDHQLNIGVPFVKAGFMTLAEGKTPSVKAWTASPWDAGGIAFIVLKDPLDQAVRSGVEKLLRGLAADPANGISRVLDRGEIAAMGGIASADFAVDMKPGFSIGAALDGPVAQEIKPGGTHGYAPTHPEMLASFLIAGPGIRKNFDLGEIDMRSIAPTLASWLGATLSTGDLPGLDNTVVPSGARKR
jgi:predicted AlkP superfamily pyrophosphatase or phosphodiesterase